MSVWDFKKDLLAFWLLANFCLTSTYFLKSTISVRYQKYASRENPLMIHQNDSILEKGVQSPNQGASQYRFRQKFKKPRTQIYMDLSYYIDSQTRVLN